MAPNGVHLFTLQSNIVTVLKYSTPLAVKAPAISAVVATHANGCPFPIGLPIVTISGQKSSPCSWKAQKWLPTRPKPVCTSSTTNTPPAERTYLDRVWQIHADNFLSLLLEQKWRNKQLGNCHDNSLCNQREITLRKDDLAPNTRQWFSKEGGDL